MDLKERATALRELADNLEAVAELEDAHELAKAAYAEDLSAENKLIKRLAADALTAARMAVRNSPIKDVDPNGMKITPLTVG
jgi:hypothetical protein